MNLFGISQTASKINLSACTHGPPFLTSMSNSFDLSVLALNFGDNLGLGAGPRNPVRGPMLPPQACVWEHGDAQRAPSSPLTQWTPLTKHKLKGKIMNNVQMATAEH